jgi:hypothetical protein
MIEGRPRESLVLYDNPIEVSYLENISVYIHLMVHLIEVHFLPISIYKSRRVSLNGVVT